MTTPDTAAVRTWARENGYEVADRGRLPAEVTDAYLAANGSGTAKRKAAAKKPAAARSAAAPAKKAPARKTAATPSPVVVAPASAPEAVQQPPAAEPAPVKAPRPKPSLVTDDRRLVALGEEIKALTQRVEALEKASGGGKSGNGKSNPFRRRS